MAAVKITHTPPATRSEREREHGWTRCLDCKKVIKDDDDPRFRPPKLCRTNRQR